MARFLPESGLLIQHIPRTGGTFVEDAIDRLGILCSRWASKQDSRKCPKKHSLLSHYHRDQMAVVKRVACFVRHPVAYYASAWRYLHESRMASRRRLSHMWLRWRWHPFRQAALLYKQDFCEWMDAMIEQEPGWATRLAAWYVGPENGEFCDFIGRTETLVPDLIELLTRLGYSVDTELLDCMGRSNQSGLRSQVVVPDDFRERICREERVLIRRFYSPDTEAKRWYRRPPRLPR